MTSETPEYVCSQCKKTLKDATNANCITPSEGKLVCWNCALEVCNDIFERKAEINAKRSAL